jgi:chromosome segregation ATPase
MSLLVGEVEIPLPTGPPDEQMLLDSLVDSFPGEPSPERVPADAQIPPARRSLRRTQLPPPQRQEVGRESRGQESPAARRSAASEPQLEATVSALRAELQERAASEAQDRARLADAQAELKARSSRQAQLEAAQAELRAELSKLHELVEQERALRSEHVAELTSSLDQLAAERDELMTHVSELRAELAGAKVAREAAEGEALGWRAEAERLGGQFAAAREELAGRDGGLGEAEDLLAQARALRTRILRQEVGVAAPAADGS